MRRDEQDQQSIALYNPGRGGGDKQEGHRGGAGMRKSAVSVRSGAGMPVHMAGERNARGGEGEICEKEQKGTICHIIILYPGRDTVQCPVWYISKNND